MLINFRYRSQEYETDDGPWDPITGGATALLGTIASLSMGVADFPIEIFKRAKTANTCKKSTSDGDSNNANSKPLAKPQADSQSSMQAGHEHGNENKGDTTPTSLISAPGSPRPSRSTTAAPSSKTSWESAATHRSSTDISSMESPQSPTSSAARGGSLKEALRGSINRARSLSRDRSKTRRESGSTPHRPGTESPFSKLRKDSEPTMFDPSKMTLENAGRASKGISRIVGAGLKSPMDFTLGLARGFHNAPKLYGDDTVRPQEKVTDFQSGLKAAGKVSETDRPPDQSLTRYRNLGLDFMMALLD